MKKYICSWVMNSLVSNVQWRKCNMNYFYFKCAGSLFEHSVSESIISHRKHHSLYGRDRRPSCNLMYTLGRCDTSSTVVAGFCTPIWKYNLLTAFWLAYLLFLWLTLWLVVELLWSKNISSESQDSWSCLWLCYWLVLTNHQILWLTCIFQSILVYSRKTGF